MTDTVSNSISNSNVNIDTVPGGGVAWSGSLVGSLNPDAPTGYRSSNPTKRYKLAGNDDNKDDSLPDNVQIVLQSRDGTTTEMLDVPISSSVDDLTTLLHTLQQQHQQDNNNNKTPYTFYLSVHETADTELTTTLKDSLIANKEHVSTETTLTIIYQPLSIFKVRPVSRNTDTLHGHTEAILHLSYAPNQTYLASGGGDKTVRFWDVYTHTTKFSYTHTDHVLCTSWSPDSSRFASGDKRGIVMIHDFFHTDKQSLQNNNKETVKPKTIKAHTSFITDMQWKPLHLCDNGNKTGSDVLVTASKDATIKLWNARTGKHVHTFSGHTDSVEQVAWSGTFLYSASRDRTVKVWNVERRILVRTLTGHGHRINTLHVSTSFLTRVGSFDYQHTKVSDIGRAKETYEAFRKEHGQDRLISGSDDYTIIFWKPESSKKPIKRLSGHQNLINDVQFSPDSRYFCSAGFDKKIKLWNGYTGDFIMTFTGHVGPVYKICWSPDSRYIVSASADSTAKLWETTAKSCRETLPGHFDEVYALDWSPVSGSVATGSKDRTVKIWNH